MIVAVPPTLAGRIHYDPRLPVQRDQLTQRLPQGTLMKVDRRLRQAVLARRTGLNGSAVVDDGPVNATFDDSPPDGSPGRRLRLRRRPRGAQFAPMSAADRSAAVLGNFTNYFGPKAAHPARVLRDQLVERTWTRGCPVAIAGPGTLTAYGPAIRKPVGSIHWAGTETSTYWNGYMDGAVRSGERAAQEVIDSL